MVGLEVRFGDLSVTGSTFLTARLPFLEKPQGHEMNLQSYVLSECNMIILISRGVRCLTMEAAKLQLSHYFLTNAKDLAQMDNMKCMFIMYRNFCGRKNVDSGANEVYLKKKPRKG